MKPAIKTILCAAALAALLSGCAGERKEAPVPPDNVAETQTETTGGESVADDLPGTAFDGVPLAAKLLDEAGEFALFSGETPEDAASNAAERARDPEMPICRNSLFLRRRNADGREEWRLLLTSGSEVNVPDDAEPDHWFYREMKKWFYVLEAHFASDGRHLWLVCDPHTNPFLLVCSYEVATRTFRKLADGGPVSEEPDGTLLVKNRKTYLSDENGEPLGAAWYDEWILPDGTSVRKTEPSQNPQDW